MEEECSYLASLPVLVAQNFKIDILYFINFRLPELYFLNQRSAFPTIRVDLTCSIPDNLKLSVSNTRGLLRKLSGLIRGMQTSILIIHSNENFNLF